MFRAVILLALFWGGSAPAASAGAVNAKPQTTAEFVCGLVNRSAKNQNLPVAFLTRLIWQESSFRPNAISPAGAQGIAQFMPGTAGERGLADPFDPEEAIPKAAELLSDLRRRFGNLGLAAAAYNGGPARVANWLAGNGALPMETRDFVLIITRHPVEDWTGAAAAATIADSAKSAKSSCLQVTALIRRGKLGTFARSAFLAPWGVQLAGSFSKAAALAAYGRARSRYPTVLGKVEPIILGSRVIARGFHPYYRIRAPAASRAAADALCNRIMRAGGACAVLRN
ncbi:MAG: lytic transglycosylase domain-containing protein [Methylovirgula sp.]